VTTFVIIDVDKKEDRVNTPHGRYFESGTNIAYITIIKN
jgi:hypothetical protein